MLNSIIHCSCQWKVVEFAEGDEVAVVRAEWTTAGEKTCFWPPKGTDIRKAVKIGDRNYQNWPKFGEMIVGEMIVLYQFHLLQWSISIN